MRGEDVVGTTPLERVKAYALHHQGKDNTGDHVHAYGTVDGEYVLRASDLLALVAMAETLEGIHRTASAALDIRPTIGGAGDAPAVHYAPDGGVALCGWKRPGFTSPILDGTTCGLCLALIAKGAR